MAETKNWIPVGRVGDLIKEIESSGGLKEINVETKKIVFTYHQGKFGALNNKCNHMGGPLSKGKLKNGCIVCPWHYWQFNSVTGESLSVEASKHFTSSAGSVPFFSTKVEADLLYVDLASESK